MRRAHAMPFGAEYLGGGETRFRLWAPALQRLDLELRDGASESSRPMTQREDGWFECVVEAAPGAAYRYRLPDGHAVPDPASRHNPRDVHAHSVVIDPRAYEWRDDAWRGRPWHEAVIYEVHVGAATPDGTFAGLAAKLDDLAALGVTALELMPLADFCGGRNWGYDGVLPFAPDAAYGTPDDLKRLVDAAHTRGLMVLVDVVYNHFGPEGNYLALYAPQFFTARHHTAWGAAINYDDAGSHVVREFFIHNALYWIEEFHVDGLRLDAVHAILDDSPRHLLEALAERVRGGPGREREVHLVLENDANRVALLRRNADGRARWYDAQWNDDWHHVFHVLLTGERDSYYADYAQDTAALLARCLAEGYVYQGQTSVHRGEPRGEPSGALPPTAFVSFLQNHDQVGNRAHGERLVQLAKPAALRAAVCAWLLSPQIPLLFMGEEYGAETPFLYFCDFPDELAEAVRTGRRKEFAAFAAFSEDANESIPDPGAHETFQRSKLRWSDLDDGRHRAWHELYTRLLRLRREHVVPLLADVPGNTGSAAAHGAASVSATWTLAGGAQLEVRLNLSARPVTGLTAPSGRALHVEPPSAKAAFARGEIPACAAAAYLLRAGPDG